MMEFAIRGRPRTITMSFPYHHGTLQEFEWQLQLQLFQRRKQKELEAILVEEEAVFKEHR